MHLPLGHPTCMRRVALLSIVALLGCKRGEAAKVDVNASKASAAPSVVAPEPLLPGATCQFPTKIEEDVTIKGDCVADVRGNVLVANGKTLTVEPGAKLRFQSTSYLEIGHKGSRLVARGTKAKPIVFTSAASAPKRGDWIGLVLDDNVGVGTVIEHAIIEYAGRESHGGQGALTVFRAFPEGRVSIRDVTFRHNETGVANTRSPFAAFERNTFSDNGRAMAVSAPVLGVFGDGNDIGDRVDVYGGTITRVATFGKSKGAYQIMEPVYVNGEGNEVASLTIARGTTLRFAPKTWLEVGTGGPAELNVAGVTFTSAAEKPKAGDWVGLFFGDKTKRASVTESIIEYAGGEEHSSDAAVTFVGTKSWQALDVNFSAVAFRFLQQAHFSSNGDGCEKALDPKHGISWAGMTEPCR